MQSPEGLHIQRVACAALVPVYSAWAYSIAFKQPLSDAAAAAETTFGAPVWAVVFAATAMVMLLGSLGRVRLPTTNGFAGTVSGCYVLSGVAASYRNSSGWQIPASCAALAVLHRTLFKLGSLHRSPGRS